MKSLSCLLADPDLSELLLLVVSNPHCYELSANTARHWFLLLPVREKRRLLFLSSAQWLVKWFLCINSVKCFGILQDKGGLMGYKRRLFDAEGVSLGHTVGAGLCLPSSSWWGLDAWRGCLFPCLPTSGSRRHGLSALRLGLTECFVREGLFVCVVVKQC